ncbi:septum formation initiator family protein [Entomospira entomophila]|uniref:Septum formation initiator n=1 Tax=Entomospira entomophila TaxID=2719988 RepID=A0A968KR61_9SPIO|nr:septum formation initiator family protein [Entomospira entomophilus]NIZ40454.1 hypothetical protein [Entomospira entomophilus]WDI36012.1 septum formation initiator family protein [Entomospira entomophilus]
MLSEYRKVWWALYFGLLSLLVTDYFWGNRGIHRQEQQSEQVLRMQENYQELLDLQVKLEALKYDYENNDETIILAARKVGYFKPGEQLIVVRGLKNHIESWDVGYIVRHEREGSTIMQFYGVFAFMIGFFLTLMLQFLLAYQGDDT